MILMIGEQVGVIILINSLKACHLFDHYPTCFYFFLQKMVHEMAMVSAIQEAQKDNLRSFNDYMMTVWRTTKIHPRDCKSSNWFTYFFEVFKGAYESLGLDASNGKSVSMQKIWHLIQTLKGEGSTVPRDVSKKMSLVIGARSHHEWGHEKYIIDTTQSHPAQVKKVIISFFILMEQGKATRQDLDLQCEELIKEEFGERRNFDVDDTIQKLEKLGIVARDSIGRYYCVSFKRANEIIGTTTEELVLKAKQSAIAP
ncbi:hypothetical protein ACSBR2_006970 [Camellia fascicularis]